MPTCDKNPTNDCTVGHQMKREEVSVLFSGGSDSTLAAAFACKQFEKVHLLTFFQPSVSFVDNSKVNAQKLKDTFGKDKVTHKIICIEELFRKLYFGNYLRDLRSYGAFLAAGACFACQIAMHTAAIIYDIENKIGSTWDGYKREKEHIYVHMSREGLELTKEFYAGYGIDYQNPVYNVLRTDWELFELGITSQKNVKFPYHVDYIAQPHCMQGVLLNAYLMSYYYPLHRKPDPKWVKYYKEKISAATIYIHDHSISKGVDLS